MYSNGSFFVGNCEISTGNGMLIFEWLSAEQATSVARGCRAFKNQALWREEAEKNLLLMQKPPSDKNCYISNQTSHLIKVQIKEEVLDAPANTASPIFPLKCDYQENKEKGYY